MIYFYYGKIISHCFIEMSGYNIFKCDLLCYSHREFHPAGEEVDRNLWIFYSLTQLLYVNLTLTAVKNQRKRLNSLTCILFLFDTYLSQNQNTNQLSLGWSNAPGKCRSHLFNLDITWYVLLRGKLYYEIMNLFF